MVHRRPGTSALSGSSIADGTPAGSWTDSSQSISLVQVVCLYEEQVVSIRSCSESRAYLGASHKPPSFSSSSRNKGALATFLAPQPDFICNCMYRFAELYRGRFYRLEHHRFFIPRRFCMPGLPRNGWYQQEHRYQRDSFPITSIICVAFEFSVSRLSSSGLYQRSHWVPLLVVRRWTRFSSSTASTAVCFPFDWVAFASPLLTSDRLLPQNLKRRLFFFKKKRRRSKFWQVTSDDLLCF